MRTYKKDGIEYKVPKVHVFDNTNLLFAEFFARTAYDSFDKSENNSIKVLKELIDSDTDSTDFLEEMREEECDSELLSQLSHVFFHKSVQEHIVFNMYIEGISRSLLQELVRHRHSSYTVKSTRYTMTDILHLFLVGAKFATSDNEEYMSFINSVDECMYTIKDSEYIAIEADSVYKKLMYQKNKIGYEAFRDLIVPKSLIQSFENASSKDEAMGILKSKSKRNIGDPFKHIVSENMSVDLGITINLSSLKNMFELRLSGSAWFQFQVLMNEIYKVIPANYMKLINNGKLDNIQSSIEECIIEGEFK